MRYHDYDHFYLPRSKIKERKVEKRIFNGKTFTENSETQILYEKGTSVIKSKKTKMLGISLPNCVLCARGLFHFMNGV